MVKTLSLTRCTSNMSYVIPGINKVVRSQPSIHIKALPREKSAVVKYRELGYSINHISKAFGRSTSWIHKVLKRAESLGILRHTSNRKQPRLCLLRTCRKRLFLALSYMKLWEGWILGEEGEPP